jgi:hypothetical protein
MKMDQAWHDRFVSEQSDHKYLEELLKRADSEMFNHVENNIQFYLSCPLFFRSFT